MQTIKDIKPYMGENIHVNIKDADVVLGFDEWKGCFVKVQYSKESNRFFDYVDTWAVYPIDRINKFKICLKN